MTTPVNLNKIRKEKSRKARKVRADENAVAFGQTKVQKDLNRARIEKAARGLEDHKRTP